jgi:branched-chain amino acid transport system substrate-binding protein
MRDESELNLAELAAMTRRRFMSRSALAGSALAAGGLLAACGSDDNNDTAAGGDAATAPAAGSGVADELQKILGKPANILSKGPGTLKVAGQFALTGAGSIYGQLQSDGWKYGAQHVAEWTGGKLKFDTKYYDNKSGVPQAEAAAGRQAGLSGVPVLVSSYIFGFGAITPFSKQYKMFTPDPGGGAGPIPGPFAGAPYCYGFRASYPTDCLDGIVKSFTEEFPDKKRIATVQPVIAPPYNNAVKDYEDKLFQQFNVQHVGEQLAPLGANNYSATVQKLKQLNPDIVIWTTFGTDVAYQAKEMRRQGLGDVLNAAVDFNPTLAKLAGPALKDWYFGFDYLNTVDPPSDWTKFFVENWKKDHNGVLPSFYNAADYITAFAVAELIDRILESGGDIHNGDDYVKALEQDPSFPHVYGGKGSELGKIVIDTKTHSPKAITMLLFQAEGTGNVKDIKPLATYNVKAAEYAKL